MLLNLDSWFWGEVRATLSNVLLSHHLLFLVSVFQQNMLTGKKSSLTSEPVPVQEGNDFDGNNLIALNSIKYSVQYTFSQKVHAIYVHISAPFEMDTFIIIVQ